jgi:uncharacterized protein YukE
MKRKREGPSIQEEERSFLQETLPEMRAHIYSFLEVPGLGCLAQTAKSFERELVRSPVGLLYYPSHWKRNLDSHRDRDCYVAPGVVSRGGDLLRDFLMQKSELHVFAGLHGGQQRLLRVRLLFDEKAKTTIFRIGDACNFVYYLKPGDGVYVNTPSSKEIQAMKETLRTQHTNKLSKERQLRQLSPEVRQERANLKEERRNLSATIESLDRELRPLSKKGGRKGATEFDSVWKSIKHLKLSDAHMRMYKINARLREIDGIIEES